ncbi:HlyU family transcriptional regulator [Devosia sp. LjRoot16]|uniref:HlyU family transcriptional regulator n=1 Tax=Devosia sp. LjRoot16 TaxID=3342271 RepID=UPI003ECC4EE9
MSFWKNLFGGGGSRSAGKSIEPAVVAEEAYKGFTVKSLIMPVGSEYQLAGLIEKEIDGELKSYKFVRADRFSSKEDVVSFALAKGRQIIDEQGDGIYRP